MTDRPLYRRTDGPEGSDHIGKPLSALDGPTPARTAWRSWAWSAAAGGASGWSQRGRLAAGDSWCWRPTRGADEFRAPLELADFGDRPRRGTSAQRRAHADRGGGAADARIAGKTAQSVGLRWRRRSVLLGISRQGRRIRAVRRRPSLPGDILLLLAPAEEGQDVGRLAGLPAAGRTRAGGDRSPQDLARDRRCSRRRRGGELRASCICRWLWAGRVGYVLRASCPCRRSTTMIEWPVIVLLGSMIPLGAALETSGGTN